MLLPIWDGCIILPAYLLFTDRFLALGVTAIFSGIPISFLQFTPFSDGVLRSALAVSCELSWAIISSISWSSPTPESHPSRRSFKLTVSCYNFFAVNFLGAPWIYRSCFECWWQGQHSLYKSLLVIGLLYYIKEPVTTYLGLDSVVSLDFMGGIELFGEFYCVEFPAGCHGVSVGSNDVVTIFRCSCSPSLRTSSNILLFIRISRIYSTRALF